LGQINLSTVGSAFSQYEHRSDTPVPFATTNVRNCRIGPAGADHPGPPIFRYSSGSSDVLHALLEYRVTPFRVLVEHSKGALQIKNEIQSLPGERTQGCAL
jgi:hypothetical protein